MRRIIIEIETDHEADNDTIAEATLVHLRSLRDGIKLMPEEVFKTCPTDAGLANISIQLEAKK